MATLLDLVKTLNKTKKAAEYNPHSGEEYSSAAMDNNILADVFYGITGSGLTNKEKAEFRYNADEAALQREREDTSIQRGVADAQAAGVNPAAIYGNIAAPASAGNSAPSTSPGSLNLGELIELIKLPQAMRIAKHQDEMAEDKNNAEIGNIVADTQLKKHQAESVSNQTEWFVNSRDYERNFLELRNQGMRDASALNAATISKIEAEIPEIQARIRLLAEQADSEEYRRALMSAQANLARVQAREIVEMLPYAQALSSAQEKNQRANAAVAFLQAGYNARLFTDEFVQATINSAIAQSQNQMSQAELNACRVWQQQFQNNLRASATQPPSAWYDLPHAFTYTLGTMLYGAADLMGSGLGGLVSKAL